MHTKAKVSIELTTRTSNNAKVHLKCTFTRCIYCILDLYNALSQGIYVEELYLYEGSTTHPIDYPGQCNIMYLSDHDHLNQLP